MEKSSVYFCVLVLISVFEFGHSNSPCPSIFGFFTDGKSVFGQITLQPDEVKSSLVIRISFTVQADLGDYLGHIDSPENVLDKYNRGETVTYKVYFPVIDPRPKVTEISLNGVILCTGPGDKPTTRVVSHQTLQLTSSYSEGDGPPPYKRFSHQPAITVEPQTTQRPIQRPTQRPTPKPMSRVTLKTTPRSSTMDYALAFVQNLNNRFGTGESASSPFHPFFFETTTTTVTPPIASQPLLPPTIEYSRPTTQKPSPTSTHYTPSTTTDECGVVAGGNQIKELVYNGQSYERGQVPWLVAIFKANRKGFEFQCGGTLVSDRHVVTAAHCKRGRNGMTLSDRDIIVKIGVHDLNEWSDTTVTMNIMKATIHESFNVTQSFQNDIMVLTLSRRVKFNRNIRPACLWSGNTELSFVVGATGIVAGWGDRGDNGINQQDEPNLVRVPIVSTKECRASNPAFHGITYNTTLCAGDRNGAVPCSGDSGGGLYLLEGGKWRLRGVVSVSLQSDNGSRSCNLNEYVVYTDTAQYLPWIRDILSIKYHD